jgi:hypothetical protein
MTPVLRNKLRNAKLTLCPSSTLQKRQKQVHQAQIICTKCLLGYTSATHRKQAKQLPPHIIGCRNANTTYSKRSCEQKELLYHILKEEL